MSPKFATFLKGKTLIAGLFNISPFSLRPGNLIGSLGLFHEVIAKNVLVKWKEIALVFGCHGDSDEVATERRVWLL